MAILAAAIVAFLTLWSNGATSDAVLTTASGAHSIDVEVANTSESREVGLMNRASMPSDDGMLFDFGETRDVTMWMKNTYISLDMLFMDERGIVTHIARNAQPLSLDIISSQGPVRYVLELNAGAASRYGVKPGDTLTHPSMPTSTK